MNTTDRLIRTALLGLIGAGIATIAPLASAADTEKCAGIVKGGKNDCGTSKNACAGQVTADNHPEAWITVPKGTCAKITGGRLQTSADAKHGGAVK